MSTVLLSPPQVAERLGLARSTLAKLRVHGGGPPYLKLGTSVRYPEDSLAAWLAARPRHTSTASESLAGNVV